MADRRVLAPGVRGPLAHGRPRPIGITAAAVILIVLWSGSFLIFAAYGLRCVIVIDTDPPQCVSAMSALALQQEWGGYTGAGFVLALGATGVVAGVRLLRLRGRGLALGLASVGILIWLGILGIVLEGPHRRPKWPGSAYEMSISRYLAIYVLGVAGYVFVILTLHGWRDRFDKATGSSAASPGTSTLASSPVPRKSRPGRFRSVVIVVAGAGLVLAGPVLALSGLVVFIDWIVGVLESAVSAGALCPPSFDGLGVPDADCIAASAKAGVLGLLAASVGLLGFWAGVRLLRKRRMDRAVSSLEQRSQAAIVPQS